MTWPTITIDTTNLDEGNDSPALARPDIKQMADNVNAIKDEFAVGDGNKLNSALQNIVEDTTPQLGGTLDCQDNVVKDAEHRNYTETVVAMSTNDVDYSAGTVHTKTITGATTITFSNLPSTGKVATWQMHIRNGSTNVTWPSSVDWGDAGAPALTTSGLVVISFMTIDAGTTVLGFVAQQGFV
jgi:hypothetical protein